MFTCVCLSTCVRNEEILREADSYVIYHTTSENQCTRLGSVPNRNCKKQPFSSLFT